MKRERTISTMHTLWGDVLDTPLARAGVAPLAATSDDVAMTVSAPLQVKTAPKVKPRRVRGDGAIWPVASGWRAAGRRIRDAEGRVTRGKTRTFATRDEAILWLRSAEALSPGIVTKAATLGQVLRNYQASHPKGARDLSFVFAECADLLSVPAINDTREERTRLRNALKEIGTRRRRTRRFAAKKGARHLSLVRPVRAHGGEWQVEIAPDEWETMIWHGGGSPISWQAGREEKRRRADLAFPRLAADPTLTMETLLPSPYRLDESRTFARHLVARGYVRQEKPLVTAGVAKATTMSLLRTLRRALEVADEHLASSAVKKITLLGESQDRETTSRTEEIARSFGQSGSRPSRRRLADLILLACQRAARHDASQGDRAIGLMAAFGMRNGEALALQCGAIDFTRGVIRIVKALDPNGRLKGTKTTNGRRDLVIAYEPIADLIGDVVSALPRWTEGKRLDGFLFDWSPHDAKIAMDRATEALCEEAKIGRLTPYHLRHSNLMMLGARNLHPNDVADRAGHANALVSMRLYCLPTTTTE